MNAPLLSYATLYDWLQVIFWACLTLAGFAFLYSWRPRKRNRRIVPRMYVDAKPEPDSRSSLEQFRKVIPRNNR